ncbi:hypothetical protein H6G64_04740 [Calothrix sp. FACHB-156]|nr:hypothetical protein [Nostoc linckia FACHB-104]MBD2336295.1 hypothetical protein [Calothrix sp. FACHB-156]
MKNIVGAQHIVVPLQLLILHFFAICAIKWSRRELNPNPATVRLLASEQSNTNRGPKICIADGNLYTKV